MKGRSHLIATSVIIALLQNKLYIRNWWHGVVSKRILLRSRFICSTDTVGGIIILKKEARRSFACQQQCYHDGRRALILTELLQTSIIGLISSFLKDKSPWRNQNIHKIIIIRKNRWIACCYQLLNLACLKNSYFFVFDRGNMKIFDLRHLLIEH